jgi:hypothetical protein
MSHEASAFAGVFNPVQQDQSWRELLYMLNLHMFWRKPSSVTPLSIPRLSSSPTQRPPEVILREVVVWRTPVRE